MLPKLAVQDGTVFMIELPPQFAEEAPRSPRRPTA